MKLNPVLKVEASIVGEAGQAIPLAGQVFYISEINPIDILRKNDLTSEIAYARTMNALRNLTSRFFITDSQGKAEIEQLKTGIYYICGVKYTQHEAGIWNVQIELLPGKNNLILNDANMMGHKT
jgi:hypothetical protein